MKTIGVLFFLVASPVLASPVAHQHGGRPHSHILPNEGLKHSHNQKALGSAITQTAKHPHGHFSGSPIFKQLPDGRKKEIIEDLVFTDPNGKKWIAPKGSIVDGASIPKPLWSLLGGPFTGKYLAASVIHDVACNEKKENWQAVHRVFYDAMLASGVNPNKAKRMYSAVNFAGPRWGKDAEKRISEEDLKKMISEGRFNVLKSSVKKPDMKYFKTWGEIKQYSGSAFYFGIKGGEPVVGVIYKKNDVHTSVEVGNDGSKIRLSLSDNDAHASNKRCKPPKDQGKDVEIGISKSEKYVKYNSPIKFNYCNTQIAGEEQDAAAKKLFGD